MKEDKVVQRGWTAITDTISGQELAWSAQEEDGPVMPDIYLTERDVQLEIIEILTHQLDEFSKGTREYDDISWEPQDTPVYIEIYESGAMIVWEGSQKYLNRIMTTTLEDWRKSL